MSIAAPANPLAGSRWIWPACVFLVLCAATLLFWHKQRDTQVAEEQSLFEHDAALVTTSLRERLTLHDQVLRTLAAYFATHPQVTANEWQRFSEYLSLEKNLSGAYLFGFAPAVSFQELTPFENAIRKNLGSRDFSVFPHPDGKLAVPAIYLAPQGEAASRSLGFNIYSEAVRRQAIDLAADNDDTVISGPVTLLFDRISSPIGFLMLHPIYRQGMPTRTVEQRRAAFAGVVYAVYRVDELMRFLDWTTARRVAFRIFDDDGRGTPPNPLYASQSDLPPSEIERGTQHELAFGHRNWLLLFQQRYQPENGFTLDPPTQTLLSGLTISALLSLILAAAVHVLERRRIAAAVESQRDELQEMVLARTAELEAALQGSQAAHQAKSEFLTNMSHELRTPMHAILGFSGLGVDRTRDPGQEKLHQYFESIRQSAGRLLDLINAVLDLSKLEAGHLDTAFADFDIVPVVQRTVTQLESLFLARQLKVSMEKEACDTVLHGDEKQIERVIHNLLSNAIKFSPAGGVISIRLAPGPLPSGMGADSGGSSPGLILTFRDYGVGIPPGELETVFEKFVQGSNAKNGAGGTGLGLAICREIVRSHRGTIAASNNQDGGASFELGLPARNRSDDKADGNGNCITRPQLY